MSNLKGITIGLDMDGVLRELDLSVLHICESIKDFKPFEVNTLTATKPLLNPMLLALPEDSLYCLTRCYTETDIRRKREWLNHFYGDRITLFTVPKCTDNWGTDYQEKVGKAKYDIIKELDSDLYIDDDPGLIRVLRRLASEDGLNCKFLKYGPWIEEYHNGDVEKND
jgi:hypothetical protein